MKQKSRINWPIIILAILIVALISSSIYSYIRLNDLASRVDTLVTNIQTLNSDLASTTLQLRTEISDKHTDLSKVLVAEQQNLGNIRQQLGTFQSQVGSITGTVSTLQKLSKTDPELLKKYSKVYFLNENYVPPRLAEIPEMYTYSSNRKILLHTDALPFLIRMIQTASSSGIKLYAYSGYRSFDEQKALKSDYRITYGAGTANTFSADQGYSEHQLGTTVDMITTGLGGVLDGFDETTAYKWMLNNAHKYGFILSYPKNNDYYVFEPWHWRYVGTKLATDLYNQKKNFYDLDQRVIDEYLVSVFD